MKIIVRRNNYFPGDFDIFVSIIKNYFEINNIGENILNKYEKIEKLIVNLDRNGIILADEIFIPIEIFAENLFILPEIIKIDAIISGWVENNRNLVIFDNNKEIIMFNTIEMLIKYKNINIENLNKNIMLFEEGENEFIIALTKHNLKYLLVNNNKQEEKT